MIDDLKVEQFQRMSRIGNTIFTTSSNFRAIFEIDSDHNRQESSLMI